jgi:hypothetical protein
MSAARYTNRVRTQSQARVTKAQYPGAVSNNYDALFSSINCNVAFNVLDYKGVPCVCQPASQPVLFSMRLGQLNRTAAVQFSIPIEVIEPVVPSIDEIDTSIAVRMALPPTESNDPVPIPKQEKIRNVSVALSVEHTEIENVPPRSYGTINRNISIIGYAKTNESPQAVEPPTLEPIRNVRVVTQAPVPTPSTEPVSHLSYEKIRNVMFKIEVPRPIRSNLTPKFSDVRIIPKFEGLRSVGVPVSVPLVTNEPAHIPRYESMSNTWIRAQIPIHISSPSPTTDMVSYPSYKKLRNITFKIDVPKPIIRDMTVIPKFEGIRNVHVSIPSPEFHNNDIISAYQIPGAYHLPGIASFHTIERFGHIQNNYVPPIDQTVTVPIYDINSILTNPRFRMQSMNADPQYTIVFGGGSENPDDYVVYGGGNSQLLL